MYCNIRWLWYEDNSTDLFHQTYSQKRQLSETAKRTRDVVLWGV